MSCGLQDCGKWQFGDYFPPSEDPPVDNTTFFAQCEIPVRPPIELFLIIDSTFLDILGL